MIYLVAMLYYMVKIVCVEDTAVDDDVDVWFGIFVLLCIAKQIHIEVYQLLHGNEEGAVAAYFKNPMNIMDLMQNLIAMTLVILTIF